MRTKTMQIMGPLNNIDEIIPLIKKGADAFYCGLTSKALFSEKTHKKGVLVNLRWEDSCNFNSKLNLKKAISLIHKNKKKVYFALNSPWYSEEAINQIA